MIAVKIVTLGRGSDDRVGKNNQYIKTWPGLNKQKSRRQTGNGSQTAISQTSLVGSGCARDSALSLPSKLVNNRSGEEDTGEESTRTRRAEGVFWGASTELSKRR